MNSEGFAKRLARHITRTTHLNNILHIEKVPSECNIA
jgi:hypothetical protein